MLLVFLFSWCFLGGAGGEEVVEIGAGGEMRVNASNATASSRCAKAYLKFLDESATNEKARLAVIKACKKGKDVQSLVPLARALGRKPETFREAAGALARAVALEPSNGELRLDLARSYASVFSLTGDEQAFAAALEAAEISANVLGVRSAKCTGAQLVSEKGDYESAIEAFEECFTDDMTQDAETSWMLFEFARVLETAGRFEEAAHKYDAAARAAPRLEIDDRENAFDHYGEALAGKALAWKKVAATSEGRKQDEAMDLSLEAYEAAVVASETAKRSNPALLLSLGDLLETRGDKAGALIAARRCVWSFLSLGVEENMEVLGAAAEVLADRADVAIARVAIDHAIFDLIPAQGQTDDDDDDFKEKMTNIARQLPKIEKKAMEEIRTDSEKQTPLAALGGEALYDAQDAAFVQAVKGNDAFKDIAFEDPASALTWKAFQKRRDAKKNVMLGRPPDYHHSTATTNKKKSKKKRKKKVIVLDEEED